MKQMIVKTYETKKDFKDAIDDYLLMGFSIEDEREDKITLKKMKMSKVLLHLGLIFIFWIIGSFFLSIFFAMSFAPFWGILFFEILLLLILIAVNTPSILEAYKGEKIIIKLRLE